MRYIALYLLFAQPPAVSAGHSEPFQLPEGFEGIWQGVPYSSVLGAWTGNNMTFAISRAESGDYLMVTNLKYDAEANFSEYWSWQRSYVKSSGQWGGDILHCPGPRSPHLKVQAMMQAHSWPASSDRSVTFCLKKWDGYVELDHPFPFTTLSCYNSSTGPGCGCFNWTMRLDESGEQLDYQVSMAGTPSSIRSRHMWVRFHRVGTAPPIAVQMPGDGDDFRCEYGSRDGHLVDGGHIAGRCPFATAQGRSEDSGAEASAVATWAPSLYPHCYMLNEAAGVVLEWRLDLSSSLLHVKVSALAIHGSESYVAIGFRPLGGASTAWARDRGTGREQRFGMRGADIVIGHAGGFQRMYAHQYTGPPLPDDSLNVSQVQTGVSDGRVYLQFTRPLIGGWLHANFESNASVASDTSDMIWAVGQYSASAGFPLNHEFSRGWREVNWTDPEFDARPLESLRPYKCRVPYVLP